MDNIKTIHKLLAYTIYSVFLSKLVRVFRKNEVLISLYLVLLLTEIGIRL